MRIYFGIVVITLGLLAGTPSSAEAARASGATVKAAAIVAVASGRAMVIAAKATVRAAKATVSTCPGLWRGVKWVARHA